EQPIVESQKVEVAVEASPTPEPVVAEPVVTEPEVAKPVVAEIPVVAVETEQPASEEHKGAKHEKAIWGEKFEAVYLELLQIKENNETIEVEIKGRIRGGLRAIYKEMPLFLPASHFSLKRTPTEQELTDAAGKTMVVQVHELQEYDEGRKAVIVSRKHLLPEEFWTKLSVGDIIEGIVSSIATFGVFVDLGGVEGLIHISRLSQVHVDDPNKFMKKGDSVKAVVVELDRTKNRIALSRKELEESPWKDVENLFLVGTQYTGIVRRLTDFGAYIELKPGVDGLLRTPEISWTKRIKKPSDVLKAGSKIPVEILSVSEEKQTVSLSYKKTQPNPWHQLVDKYPVGTEYQGVVSQVMPQGCIIAINDEVDGFMP
ncbi:MAG: S1 RNA-binding domain-containing protein, partial [Ignavibacteria bacterium]|nr:S1 RNA-binding domain-containing protein [Ignavibacteria bacterium]